MRIPTLLLAAGMGLAATSFSSAQEASNHRWFDDFDSAMKIAIDEDKDLLVDFTGSDWCHWCIKLHEEVFAHDAFYDKASKHFVLVALDFPNAEEIKAKVPNPKRNQELAAKYGIQGYPTILLINRNEDVFASTGYQEGGPEKYITHLADISKEGKIALKVVAKLTEEFQNADEKAKPALVKKAITSLTEADSSTPGRQSLAKIVRAGLEMDPKNESGLKLECLSALLKSGVSNGNERSAAQIMDPKNELGLFEIVVSSRIEQVRDADSASAFVDSLLAFKEIGMIHDKEMIQGLAVNCAFWCKAGLDRPDEAKLLAEWAKSLGDLPKDALDALNEMIADEPPAAGNEG